MNKTEATLSFSNKIYIIFALYYFELFGESIIKRSADVGSIPIRSTRAYYHKSII